MSGRRCLTQYWHTGQATRRLIAEHFDLEDTGTHVLKGITGKVRAWRVLAEHETDDSRASMPLVGRQEELGLLLRAWEASKENHGQVVLVQGEAGIGKSRLLQALRERAAKDDFTWGIIRCSPFHTNSALHPVIEQLKGVAGWRRDDNEAIKLEKLEMALGKHSFSLQEAVRLVGELLSLELPEDRHPPLELTPAAQKQLTLDTIVAWLLEEAERRPVLQVWEDLHWADPSTLELLGLFIEQAPTVPVLVLNVCTFRPDFAPPWPPRSHMTPITLNRLEPLEMVAIIGHLARGKALPKELTDHIIAKTDGVPLFVEELTKNLLESNVLLEKVDRYELTGSLSEVAIPETLQDSLMARLDRIPTGPEVAQWGAVLGREFAYEMLASLPAIDERDLRASLGHLVHAELLYQRGRPPHARYIFKHALIQDAAYQSLLRRTRKNYHREVAELLETRFSDVAAAQPEMVAHHYTEAGLIERALTYWQRAGQLAIERSSNTEGIAHFRKALELISMIESSEERKGQELAVQSSLGSALMATRGYAAPEVADAYARARDLCQELGDKTQLFPVLWGLWLYYLGKGEHRAARGLGEQLLELAHDADDPTLLLEADLALGATLFFLGEFKQALEHLDRGIASYDPEEHRELAFRYGNLDPGATCLAYAGCSLCLLGHIDQATRRSQESLQVAEETSHRFTLSRALNWNSQLYQFCRDRETVRELAGRAFKLATESGFPLVLAQAPIMLGWAAIEMEAHEEGIDKMKEGLSAWQSTGAGMYRPYYLGLLAEAYGRCGEPQQGLSVLAESKSLVEKTDERFYEAELCRLEGTLLLQCDEGHEGRAERSFLAALEVARRQKAKLLELRAAVSLGRLWRDQGRSEEARELVAEVHGWFMEGIDTPDLKEARDLLRDPLEASSAEAVAD